jgi:hypothetical protein
MTKRWLWWIVGVAFVVRLGMWSFFATHFLALVTWRLPDDALYYFTIAQNIASGFGISFDGIHPTNGMHPLWLFAITPIFFLGLSKIAAINVVLLLQSLIDVVVVWLIGSTVFKALDQSSEANRKYAAGAAALLYALSPFTLMRGINGLETTLTSFVLMLWLRTYWSAVRDKRFVALGLVTGFLLLARTDSFLIILPLCICSLWGRKIGIRQALVTAVIALIIVAPWLLWNYATFGSILQSSAQAVPIMAMRKYNVIYGPSLKYVYLLIDTFKNVLKPFWYSTAGIALLTIGYSILAKRKEFSATYRAVLWLVGGGILLLAIHSFFRGFIRDWYVEELLPLFLVAYGISIGVNADRTSLSRGVWRLATVILIIQLWMNRQPMYASQQTVIERGVPLVENLSEHASIASLNSGYYGYFAKRPGSIINLDGVVNPEAVRSIKHGDLNGLLKRDSVEYILEFQGDFGGYLNLIDHHMLDDYYVDSAFPARETKLLLMRRSVRAFGNPQP